jgi:hypothetical protein
MITKYHPYSNHMQLQHIFKLLEHLPERLTIRLSHRVAIVHYCNLSPLTIRLSYRVAIVHYCNLSPLQPTQTLKTSSEQTGTDR